MPLTNTERTKTLPHQDAARKDSERDGSRATPGEPSSPPRRAAPTPASQARHHPAAPPHLASQARHRDPAAAPPRAAQLPNGHLSQHPTDPSFTRPVASLARRLCRDHSRGESPPHSRRGTCTCKKKPQISLRLSKVAITYSPAFAVPSA